MRPSCWISLVFLLVACHQSPEPLSELEPLARPGERRAEEGVAHAQSSEGRVAPRRRPPLSPVPVDVVPVDTVPGDQRAPAMFVARLVTTKGNVDIEVHRDWAPHGADRFYTLVREAFFSDIAMFRVIAGFMAQGGIHGDPAIARAWMPRRIPDDPVTQHNTRGMVSYAMAGPGTRTTQFFISLVDNSRLDPMGFAPFGRVRDMTAVDRLHSGYGEGAPNGQGPAQGRVQTEGNAYLRAEFPALDYINAASILEPPGG